MAWSNSGWRSSDGGWYKNASGASYTGPGDIVSGAAMWASPARAYSAAFAAGGTAIMDLKDQAGANPITINILSTGFADVTAISNWVATNSVTTIRVAKLYDQTGNSKHFTQATLATMPTLVLNTMNSLPGLVFSGAQLMQTSNTFTTTLPFSFSTVAKRTAGSGVFAVIISEPYVNSTPNLGFDNSANQVDWNSAGGNDLRAAATDNVSHAIQATAATGPSNIVYIDGSSSSNASGLGSTTAGAGFVIGSANFGGGNALTGNIMEIGYWQSLFSAGNAGSLNTNQHSSTFGYNF